MKDLKCEFCGTLLEYDTRDNRYHCPYCGACFDNKEDDLFNQETIIKAKKETIRENLKKQINKSENISNESNDFKSDLNDTQASFDNIDDYQIEADKENFNSETIYDKNVQENPTVNKKYRFNKSSLLILLIILISSIFIIANVLYK